MKDIIALLKEHNEYTSAPHTCKECEFFKEDMATDNFGPGDRCNRNPDISFCVEPNGCCNKWTPKKAQ